MCGIVGIYNFKGNVEKHDLYKMLKQIEHRGPDYKNVFLDKNIGLGHNLLKIQDISNLSHQPYVFNNLVIVYNGEIYNFQEIKAELKTKGYTFLSYGDTEVVAKSFDYWGLDAVKKFNGFFSIAIYNKEKKSISLIRDRVGIKPLYYYIDSDRLIFSSEIKSIFSDDTICKNINLDTILLSFSTNLWLPYYNTFFEKIEMLEPGTIIIFNKNGIQKKYKYFKPSINIKYKKEKNAIILFKESMKKSIKYKSLSKFQIATFLSGGIDSSIITKEYSDLNNRIIDSFTIYYKERENKDLKHAESLTKKEKIRHHKILVKPENINMQTLDEVIFHMEELLMDKVYISDYLNYKAAKEEGFRVILNGQGSDELWLGYIKIWNIYKFVENNFNKKMLIDSYFKKNIVFKEKLSNYSKNILLNILDEYISNNILNGYQKEYENYTIYAIKTILHNLLLQEDKLSMAHSIECRVPFVDDNKMLELGLTIDSNLKLFDKKEKYILRKAYEKILPKNIIQRNKYPFPEPPNKYDSVIKLLCKNNWENIINNKIISYLIDTKKYSKLDYYNPKELWWLLNIYRFTEIFN
ncbi:asparagine synthase (glutamine-hydrolysing) [Marinitoga hydrogenitolerans DSM 16785]|uniref:asparagine synthase (glutamine-hydrolyzing) n=1 Tax=Marinitoga hydrogenitolerans (strain DSM 16785 / JCM 12826 / AT1271) TaxID=1122195 RepID=A0A1M4Y9V2_MARH1|nr:asparagine synthase (glutamine-hydrolyzing) [Marinitoga hydrogenitolerans]SHF02272.1 asparagine synthase (glutamine-hydrolysing) [Marinitoga hydrogenitolerans DSM 16785]